MLHGSGAPRCELSTVAARHSTPGGAVAASRILAVSHWQYLIWLAFGTTSVGGILRNPKRSTTKHQMTLNFTAEALLPPSREQGELPPPVLSGASRRDGQGGPGAGKGGGIVLGRAGARPRARPGHKRGGTDRRGPASPPGGAGRAERLARLGSARLHLTWLDSARLDSARLPSGRGLSRRPQPRGMEPGAARLLAVLLCLAPGKPRGAPRYPAPVCRAAPGVRQLRGTPRRGARGCPVPRRARCGSPIAFL